MRCKHVEAKSLQIQSCIPWGARGVMDAHADCSCVIACNRLLASLGSGMRTSSPPMMRRTTKTSAAQLPELASEVMLKVELAVGNETQSVVSPVSKPPLLVSSPPGAANAVADDVSVATATRRVLFMLWRAWTRALWQRVENDRPAARRAASGGDCITAPKTSQGAQSPITLASKSLPEALRRDGAHGSAPRWRTTLRA